MAAATVSQNPKSVIRERSGFLRGWEYFSARLVPSATAGDTQALPALTRESPRRHSATI
jgi:hypothetical protein